jgi:hypothetical protein
MKRASCQLIQDSAETTGQCETTAQLLEDLAAHADNDEERQRCLAAARNFRLVAQEHIGELQATKTGSHAK